MGNLTPSEEDQAAARGYVELQACHRAVKDVERPWVLAAAEVLSRHPGALTEPFAEPSDSQPFDPLVAAVEGYLTDKRFADAMASGATGGVDAVWVSRSGRRLIRRVRPDLQLAIHQERAALTGAVEDAALSMFQPDNPRLWPSLLSTRQPPAWAVRTPQASDIAAAHSPFQLGFLMGRDTRMRHQALAVGQHDLAMLALRRWLEDDQSRLSLAMALRIELAKQHFSGTRKERLAELLCQLRLIPMPTTRSLWHQARLVVEAIEAEDTAAALNALAAAKDLFESTGATSLKDALTRVRQAGKQELVRPAADD